MEAAAGSSVLSDSEKKLEGSPSLSLSSVVLFAAGFKTFGFLFAFAAVGVGRLVSVYGIIGCAAFTTLLTTTTAGLGSSPVSPPPVCVHACACSYNITAMALLYGIPSSWVQGRYLNQSHQSHSEGKDVMTVWFHTAYCSAYPLLFQAGHPNSNSLLPTLHRSW